MKFAQIYDLTVEDLPSGNFHLCAEDNTECFFRKTVTPEELLQFTRDLAEMQGLAVVNRDEIVTLLDDAKQTVWDHKPANISLSDLLDKLRDFANNNKLVNP